MCNTVYQDTQDTAKVHGTKRPSGYQGQRDHQDNDSTEEQLYDRKDFYSVSVCLCRYGLSRTRYLDAGVKYIPKSVLDTSTCLQFPRTDDDVSLHVAIETSFFMVVSP